MQVTTQNELRCDVTDLTSMANQLINKLGALSYHTDRYSQKKAAKAAQEVYDLLDKMGLTSASALGIAQRWENE